MVKITLAQSLTYILPSQPYLHDMGKYWCKPCKTYVDDTKLQRAQHEKSLRHKNNLANYIKDLKTQAQGEVVDDTATQSAATTILTEVPPPVIITRIEAPVVNNNTNPPKDQGKDDDSKPSTGRNLDPPGHGSWKIKEKAPVVAQTFAELIGEPSSSKDQEEPVKSNPEFKKRKKRIAYKVTKKL